MKNVSKLAQIFIIASIALVGFGLNATHAHAAYYPQQYQAYGYIDGYSFGYPSYPISYDQGYTQYQQPDAEYYYQNVPTTTNTYTTNPYTYNTSGYTTATTSGNATQYDPYTGLPISSNPTYYTTPTYTYTGNTGSTTTGSTYTGNTTTTTTTTGDTGSTTTTGDGSGESW